MTEDDLPEITLPKNWPASVVQAVIHLIALAHYTFVRSLGVALETPSEKVRARAEIAQLQQALLWRDEQISLLRARFDRVPPQRRPHYLPRERLNILELQAAAGWSNAETARRFLVTAETIAEWKHRGDGILVAPPEPVNRYPELARYAVQRLKTLCPLLGKQKIADVLCRAGIHLAASTVGRILKEPPTDGVHDDVVQTAPFLPGENAHGDDVPEPDETTEPDKKPEIVAKYPGHVWHIDLTIVPTADGLAAPWYPFALNRSWPFCWWVAVAVDHFSRCAIGFRIFTGEPTSEEVRQWFAELVETSGMKPKHLITDHGVQFTGNAFVNWCKDPRNDVRQRFGAVGKYGSVAVVERFILSLKNECTLRLVVPLDADRFEEELAAWFRWYNEYRPHTKLGSKTPNEVRYSREPANEQPRIEPRAKWTPRMKCARPHAAIRGDPGDTFSIRVDYHRGRRHLPIVSVAHIA